MTDTTSNAPNSLDALISLAGTLEILKAVDLERVAPANLVPLVKAVKDVAAFAAALDAQIQMRAVTNGELLPGVMLKDEVKHRVWVDKEAAEQLAQETFGDKAFKRELLSPAQIEKLGPEGKGFVALASIKPPAGKKAVY